MMGTGNNQTPIPAVFCWSGGKDSAYALHLVQQQGRYEVKRLMSTINGENGRLSMHGIREQLMDAQAKALNIPLQKIYVYGRGNETYETAMNAAFAEAAEQGIRHVIFGDIFLEDLRVWRERQMAAFDIQCVFPLWTMNTLQLANDFIAEGFKTIICCVNGRSLDASWCGRQLDHDFLSSLPPGVDACGENGEYHSFCFDGPVFHKPVAITIGETVHKPLVLNRPEGNTECIDFWYCDLLPAAPEDERL